MKKITLSLLCLSNILFAGTPNMKVLDTYTIVSNEFQRDETAIDLCIKNQVWRKFVSPKGTSFSQILVRNDFDSKEKLAYPSSIPLECEDYEKWSNNIEFE